MKTKEKKQLIAKLIEKYVENGYCIEQFIGKPISWFDGEKIEELLENKYFWKKISSNQQTQTTE